MATTMMSIDARKVLNKFPYLDRFFVERALFKAWPASMITMLAKVVPVNDGLIDADLRIPEKDIKAVMAKCMCGYIKGCNRGIGEIKWDQIMLHYYYLTERYLDGDFPYTDLVALNDIAGFDMGVVDNAIRKIRVANLWYLRKVLIKDGVNEVEYKMGNEIPIDTTPKGAKVEVSSALKDFQC